jgi:hypothetical protein
MVAVALQPAVAVTVVLLGRPAVAAEAAAEATARAEATTGHPAVAVVASAEATVPLPATAGVPAASGSEGESPARIATAVFPGHKPNEAKSEFGQKSHFLLTFLCLFYCSLLLWQMRVHDNV